MSSNAGDSTFMVKPPFPKDLLRI